MATAIQESLRLELPVGETPVKILDMCIDDIKNGYWICGHLKKECILNGRKKPEGCAVGLVGINSGAAKIYVTWIERLIDNQYKDVKETRTIISNPTNRSTIYSDTAKDAIRFLARTVPDWQDQLSAYAKSRFNKEGYISVDTATNIVINYNDYDIDEKEVLSWFRRARKLAIAEAAKV